MSYGRVLDDRAVIGRKPHWCLHCGRIIAKGDRHRAVKVVGDDGIETQRECLQCETLAGVIYAHDPDLMYEEFWDLGEYVIENAPGSDLDASWRLRWAAVTTDQARALAVACFPPKRAETPPAPHTPPETRSRAGDAEEDDRE